MTDAVAPVSQIALKVASGLVRLVSGIERLRNSAIRLNTRRMPVAVAVKHCGRGTDRFSEIRLRPGNDTLPCTTHSRAHRAEQEKFRFRDSEPFPLLRLTQNRRHR